MSNLNKLPADWRFIPLEDAVEVVLGQSPRSSTYNDSSEGLPFFQGKTEFGAIYPTVRKWCTEPKKIAEKDDVLVSVRAPVGPTNLAPSKCAIGRGLAALRPLNGEDSKYFLYLIRRYQQDLAALGTGTTFEAISGTTLKSFMVPVPPPEQQKQIVDKIEQLFSHIDAGIEALNTAKQRLKQYRQSVLKAAVTGELTKEWREANKENLEPASQLLKRILQTRRQKWEEQQLEQFKAKGKIPKNDKWKEKYKEPLQPEFEHVHDVPDIPKNWEWVTLSQLTTFVKDGPHYSPKYAESGIPFITGGNVRAHGVDFEKCKYITQELHEELSKRCKPELNDILFTKGGTTGIARVNTYDIDFNVWVHVAVLRLADIRLIEPFFIQHSLNSLLCYAQSQKYTHGVGNQDLGLTRMIKICLALPSIEEQREIIKIIDQKMESITRVEKQVDHMLVMSEKNKQSILASAFSGTLIIVKEEEALK